MKCPNCTKEISDEEAVCPNCGSQLEEKPNFETEENLEALGIPSSVIQDDQDEEDEEGS